MEKKIVVDMNVSWGQVSFKDAKDAMLLFDLLQRASHIDNDYLVIGEGSSRSYYYVSDREINASIRSINICSDEEIADYRAQAKAYKEAQEAAKAAQEESIDPAA